LEKTDELSTDEKKSFDKAYAHSSEIFKKARAGDEKASKEVEVYYAKSLTLSIVDPTSGLDQTSFNTTQFLLNDKAKKINNARYQDLKSSLAIGYFSTMQQIQTVKQTIPLSF